MTDQAAAHLRKAFESQGITFPVSMLQFLKDAATGKEGAQARFAVYTALSHQIIHVEGVVQHAGGRVPVLVYPEPLLVYIRTLGNVIEDMTKTPFKVSTSKTACNQELTSATASFCREIDQTLVTSAADEYLSNKTAYPTTINLNASPDGSYFRALHSLAKQHRWQRIAYVCEYIDFANDGYTINSTLFPVNFCGRGVMDDLIRDLPDTVPYVMNQLLLMTKYGSTEMDYDKIFSDKVVGQCRAILLLLTAENIRQFMLQAANRRLTSGEHVFLTMQHINPHGKEIVEWQANDSDDQKAADAFRALLVISEVETDLHSKTVRMFFDDVGRVATSAYNLTGRPKETDTFWAVRLMDSILLVAEAVNRSWSELPKLDAKTFVRHAGSHFYRLLSHEVYLDFTDSLVVPIPVLRFNSSSRKWQVAYFCHPLSFNVTTPMDPNLRDILWFGHDSLPREIPLCGLQNQFCPWYNHPENAYLGPLLFLFFVIALIASVYYIRKYYFRRRFRHLYLNTWTNVQLVEESIHGHDNAKIADARDVKILMGYVEAVGTVLVTAQVHPQIFLSQTVKNIGFWRSTLTIHDNCHKNLTKFYGVTFLKATGRGYFVSEDCSKGQLRHLLASNTLLSDIQFRLAFIHDLAEGLSFIHKSTILSHGDLNIQCCLVDRHFTVKISQSGYTQLRHKLVRNSAATYTAAKFDVPSAQSKDIENFGKILHELISQVSGDDSGTPFHGCHIREIVDKLEFAETACQYETIWRRPNAADLLRLVKHFIDSDQTLIERIMNKVAEKADCLQGVVIERTKALVEETEKVDTLLREILPKYIITKLRNHELIEAELFESATVLFSDIPVFSLLVNQCTPMIIVEFLNAVYSAFDSTVGKFDAYKVETINDQYLVTSGIPNRNGISHAAEICAVALDLRRVGHFIKITSGQEIQVNLRIGINTGSVAAGIVGKRMPRYCLFGDAINLASRMESHGQTGKIHIGESTVSLANMEQPERYEFEARGLIEIKGKGFVSTYYLAGLRKTNDQLNYDLLVELLSKDTDS